MDEAKLIAKLRRIEALYAGATTDGEKDAAERARSAEPVTFVSSMVMSLRKLNAASAATHGNCGENESSQPSRSEIHHRFPVEQGWTSLKEAIGVPCASGLSL